MEELREINFGNFSSYFRLCRLTERSNNLVDVIKKAELRGYRVIKASDENIEFMRDRGERGHNLAYIFPLDEVRGWGLWEEICIYELWGRFVMNYGGGDEGL